MACSHEVLRKMAIFSKIKLARRMAHFYSFANLFGVWLNRRQPDSPEHLCSLCDSV